MAHLLPMNMVMLEHAVEETVEAAVQAVSTWYHDHFDPSDDFTKLCKNCSRSLDDNGTGTWSSDEIKQALLAGTIPAKHCHCSKKTRTRLSSLPVSLSLCL